MREGRWGRERERRKVKEWGEGIESGYGLGFIFFLFFIYFFYLLLDVSKYVFKYAIFR